MIGSPSSASVTTSRARLPLVIRTCDLLMTIQHDSHNNIPKTSIPPSQKVTRLTATTLLINPGLLWKKSKIKPPDKTAIRPPKPSYHSQSQHEILFTRREAIVLPSTLTAPGRNPSGAVRATSSHSEVCSDAPDSLTFGVCSPSASVIQLLCIMATAVVECIPGTHFVDPCS